MPSARSYSSASPRVDRGTRAGRGRVSWERKLRALMLCVLALIGWIGLKAMLALIATHGQAQQELNLVSSLQREHRTLQRQQAQLNQPSTIIGEARALGMVRAGEKPYVVTGLPSGR
jgi:cell division protein FtsB